MDAARTALALPDLIPSTKWSKFPTPPDAIIGILTLDEIFPFGETYVFYEEKFYLQYLYHLWKYYP